MMRLRQLRMMSPIRTASAISMAVMLIGGSVSGAENGTATVLAANARFYMALNKIFVGDLTPMKSVWSHADDVTYMGPTGEFERGWATVLKDWEGQAAMKLGGKVEPGEIHVLAGRDLAVVSDYEMGENTNANGKVEQLKL